MGAPALLSALSGPGEGLPVKSRRIAQMIEVTVGRGPVLRHAAIFSNVCEGQAPALRIARRLRGTGPRATVLIG